MSGEKRSDRKVIIHKPDIGEVETFHLMILAIISQGIILKALSISAMLRD